MICPCIDHLRHLAIVNTDPSIKNSGHYFQQKNNNELGICKSGAGEKFYFSYKPGKKNKVRRKQKIMLQSSQF
jgi:hypothetical protein